MEILESRIKGSCGCGPYADSAIHYMVVKGYGRATRSEYGPAVMGDYTVYQLAWLYEASATITVSGCDQYSASYAAVYPTYMKIT